MRLSNVQFISINRSQSSVKNEELPKQESNPLKNNGITASIWGTENKSKIPFAPYFSGVNCQGAISPDHENPGSFKVCNIDKLTCPSCGKPMLPRPLYEELKRTLDRVHQKEYLNVLSDYKPYMTEVEANVYKEVKDLAFDFPEMTLQELVLKLKDEKLPQLEAIQFKNINYMKSITNGLQKNEKSGIIHVLISAEEKIKARSVKHPFKRKDFIADVESLRIHDSKAKQRLVNIAKSFPSSSEAECAWVVKYSGRNNEGKQRSSREIAERFLLHSANNTDHMLARDLGGKDRIPNYITMHSGCNGDKTNKTFMEWFDEEPEERTVFIQKYLEETQAAIDNGEISDPRYQNYPQEAAQTINKLSGGRLNFTIKSTPAPVG